MTTTPATNYTAVGATYVKTDSPSDPYTDEELQGIEEAVDAHDHSAGRGLAVQRLGTGVIVEANLANDAVTFDKLSDSASVDASRAVGANHIRNDAVITRTILDGSVTATKLGTGAWSGLTFPRAYAGYVVNSHVPHTSDLTTISFTAADLIDNDNLHSPSVNPERITIGTSGWYLVFGFVKFAANSTGVRELYFRFTRSGVDTYLQLADSRPASTGGQPTQISLIAPFELQAGDYLVMRVWQSSTVDLIVQDAGFGVTGFGG